MAGAGHDVFISHSAKDKPVADAICAALETNRIRCWVAPRDVLPGQQWAGAILDAISNSRLMILIYSASANTSPQVIREVDRAINHNVTIVPFRIEDAPMSKEMEYYISSAHWLDALDDPARHLGTLVRTVKRLLDEGGPTGAPVDEAPQAVAPPPKKNRSSAGPFVLAMILLLGLGAAAFWWYQNHPAEPPTPSPPVVHVPSSVPTSVPTPTVVTTAPRPVTTKPQPKVVSTRPATVPATKPVRVDVLQLVDLSKDTISGNWSLHSGELTVGPHRSPIIEIPYVPPAEYDFRIAFIAAPGAAHQLTSILAEGDHQFIWMLGGLDNTTCGFASVDNKNFSNNQTSKTATAWISDDRPHVSLVKVRRDSIEAYLDGTLISSLKTDYKNIKLSEVFKLKRSDTIGLSMGNAITVRSIDVIEMSGPGKSAR
jgi:hypothetical protein